jgi:hypothetical protein
MSCEEGAGGSGDTPESKVDELLKKGRSHYQSAINKIEKE